MDENEFNKDKKTILIVDDEKPIVDILKFNLEKEGFATAVAYDGDIDSFQRKSVFENSFSVNWPYSLFLSIPLLIIKL